MRDGRDKGIESKAEKIRKLLKENNDSAFYSTEIVKALEVKPADVMPNVRYDRPTVLFVYNFWNTSAQEQLDIYRNVSSEFSDEYRFVPLTTLEPANVNWRQLNRGRYDIEFLKPTLDFYDNYKIISLPQFFLINEQRELLGIIVGPHSQEELLGLLESYLIE